MAGDHASVDSSGNDIEGFGEEREKKETGAQTLAPSSCTYITGFRARSQWPAPGPGPMVGPRGLTLGSPLVTCPMSVVVAVAIVVVRTVSRSTFFLRIRILGEMNMMMAHVLTCWNVVVVDPLNACTSWRLRRNPRVDGHDAALTDETGRSRLATTLNV